jgi:hypothetical protein
MPLLKPLIDIVSPAAAQVGPDVRPVTARHLPEVYQSINAKQCHQLLIVPESSDRPDGVK